MSDKTFVGQAKKITTKFGDMTTLSISEADFQKHKNERGWLNLVIKTSKEGTPYAELNDWKPKAEQS